MYGDRYRQHFPQALTMTTSYDHRNTELDFMERETDLEYLLVYTIIYPLEFTFMTQRICTQSDSPRYKTGVITDQPTSQDTTDRKAIRTMNMVLIQWRTLDIHTTFLSGVLCNIERIWYISSITINDIHFSALVRRTVNYSMGNLHAKKYICPDLPTTTVFYNQYFLVYHVSKRCHKHLPFLIP